MTGQALPNAGPAEDRQIDTPRIEAARRNAARLLEKLDLGARYPFRSNFVETPMGAMHFVDEGAGAPILMLHGNPTWSYLYRAFITAFAGTHRVVAPDHIGFGLSEKPAEEGAYTIDAHIRNLEALVTSLDLTDITLVMQDWGGPIGLGMASRLPERVARLVILNTFGFYPPAAGMDPENLKLPAPLRLMRASGIGDFLVRGRGFFERVAMPMATGDKRAWKAHRDAYTGVFESYGDRAGVMAFPRLIPASTAHPTAKILLEETGPYLDAFDGPARIFWGMKDPLFPVAALHAWTARLPQAEVTELAEAKHYVQEDAPEALIAGLRAFLG
ncbi:MAG: alpha/beta fold hydrolase [Pseudomonadota bacterium]